MSTELLMEGADAYTSLAEVAAVPGAETQAALPPTVDWILSICTLTIQGGC
ncbi:LxmA leader domain family RiPP [Nonomuraea sp. CA-218870]|uniref:LxmA leader domain family RiPP n=1 Tax=Nonomuraea corallina TaxID=2989783 RepID=A0ABT4SMN3_9ACTN|nr:LxmA leader domain family RiPP [Nonomuraea corallina]MDA0638265.1 LxmA leader domain family RiPP [Nonomuraea corallina]